MAYKWDTVALTIPVTETNASRTVSGPLDNYLVCNRAGTVTLTLPTVGAAAWPVGRPLTVKTIQAQAVVSASSNVLPQGSATPGTAILAATAGKWARLVPDGTNWTVMESN